MRTYGTVTWRGESMEDWVRDRHGKIESRAAGVGWEIACEPHVMIQIKRVFERIHKGSHKSAFVSDAPQAAYDLRWFMLRWPMIVEPLAQEHLDARCAEYEQRLQLVGELLAENFVPRPFEMALPPRTYQATAAELALRSGSLLCADDVGLGKTVTAIAMLSDPRARPALVVTLTHLPKQWTAEVNRFLPTARVHTLRSGQPYDLHKVRGRDVPFPDVIISNYHKLSGWADVLAGVVKSVVFDEVQELRRQHSAKYNAAKHVAHAATFRLGLSATPIYNYGSEIFSVLNVLAPGQLGSMQEFGREWCGGEWSDDASVSEPDAFGKFVRENGLMLRRTRADVGRELPGCQSIPYEIDVDLAPLEEVRVTMEDLARKVLAQGASGFDVMKASGELDWKLREATGVAKAKHVAAFVRLLVESGERVVLYGWHHRVYDIWREELAGLRPRFFSGEESPTQKDAAKHAFINGETMLLIVSLRAGAGMDGLQKVCRTVVFGELDWSPGVHEQCIGRVYRDGQPEKVAAYYLIADVGSDPVVVDVLGVKRQQAEGIVNPDAPLVERLHTDADRVKKLAADYLARAGARSVEAAA